MPSSAVRAAPSAPAVPAACRRSRSAPPPRLRRSRHREVDVACGCTSPPALVVPLLDLRRCLRRVGVVVRCGCAYCPDGRSCRASTFGKGSVLYGDTADADYQASIISAPPPVAPPPPDTCAPDGGWACTDALRTDAIGCAAFADACTAYCGECECVAAGTRATTTCAAPATSSYPDGFVILTCSCGCGTNANCVATPNQQCAWELSSPPSSPPPPIPPRLPPDSPKPPPPLP